MVIGLWSRGIFDFIITSTEFQKRGWPHWHMLLFLNLPWKLDDLTVNHAAIPDVIRFFENHISTDPEKTTNPRVQTHHHYSGRCFKGGKRKNICKYGFPKFPMSE